MSPLLCQLSYGPVLYVLKASSVKSNFTVGGCKGAGAYVWYIWSYDVTETNKVESLLGLELEGKRREGEGGCT